MRIIKISAVIFMVFLLISEVAVRFMGLVDFPLYDADTTIGYIPKANQQGRFLNKNDWEFNALHMGADEFNPTEKNDTLLIGDSVVLGGNPYAQQDRLGPRLQQAIKSAVWPISAGSWALKNELTYLRLNPEVVKKTDRFVFMLNSGDFDKASSWACRLTHPKSRPISALVFLIEKNFFMDAICTGPDARYHVADSNLADDLTAFTKSTDKPVYVFLYADKEEAGNKMLLDKKLESNISFLKQSGIKNITSVARDNKWNTSLYRDSIHPTIEGTKILAAIIAQDLN